MLNGIIQRHSKISPLSETEIRIIECAVRLFFENGFTKTSHRMIAKESGYGLGTVTYHFRAKEDLLQLLLEELMDFHLDVIEESGATTKDSLLSYALEIAMQLALCENDRKAWDLYYAAYSHGATFEYIKEWAAKKNYHLLKDRTPHLDETDYRNIENFTSGIELAAFNAPTNRYFTLNDKIALTLDSMMKIYDISADDRKKTIDKVLQLDCEKIAVEMFEKFSKKLDKK